jgi:hypothetical protein
LNIASLTLPITMNSASLDGKFVASGESSTSSDDKSESKTLAELERGRTEASQATKQRKKTKYPTVALAKKKKKPAEKGTNLNRGL